MKSKSRPRYATVYKSWTIQATPRTRRAWPAPGALPDGNILLTPSTFVIEMPHVGLIFSIWSDAYTGPFGPVHKSFHQTSLSMASQHRHHRPPHSPSKEILNLPQTRSKKAKHNLAKLNEASTCVAEKAKIKARLTTTTSNLIHQSTGPETRAIESFQHRPRYRSSGCSTLHEQTSDQ